MRQFFLLSIKPEYCERIYAGEKKIELRRRRLGLKRGDVVVVYTSSPTQALTGAFIVHEEFELPVRAMWQRHQGKLGINRADYNRYYTGAKAAVGIAIGKAVRVPSVSLLDLRRAQPGFSPPQSFMYYRRGITEAVAPEALEAILQAA